jgi:hypothetical protein
LETSSKDGELMLIAGLSERAQTNIGHNKSAVTHLLAQYRSCV